MTINFNLTGTERKNLVTAISQILETPAVYLKTPTYAYQVGEYHIDKVGTLTGPCSSELLNATQAAGFTPESIANYKPTFEDEPTADEEQAQIDAQLAEHENQLAAIAETEALEAEEATTEFPKDYTYRAELSDPDYPDRMEIFSATDDEDAIRQAYAFTTHEVLLLELHQMDEDYNEVRSIDLPPNPYRLTIEVPLEGWSPEKIDILCKMVTAKETLIKTALGAEAIPIQLREDSIRFPWFQSENVLTAEEVEAYSTFISLLCTTAKEKKRVNGKEKQSDSSPKFLMRVFLLSLGGIGVEYKNMRKVLLSKLSGSSAWPKGAPPKAEKTETVEAVLEGGQA